MSLLEVDDLRVCFATENRSVYAVNGVSFSIEAGEAVAIVGESASGKTVTALSLLGLHAESQATLSGSIRFDGRALNELSEAEWRTVRGNDIAMGVSGPRDGLKSGHAGGSTDFRNAAATPGAFARRGEDENRRRSEGRRA